ncbi:MAG: hypothetical protein ACLPH3_00920 [Terracidiphilus sp.]
MHRFVTWLSEASREFEAVWTHRATALTILLITAAVSLWAICTVPSMGTSIAILGGVAALMTTRDTMPPLEKAGYIVVITILLVAEVKAIRNNDATVKSDKDAQNAQYETLKHQTQQLRDQASTILTNTNTAITAGQVQFANTMEQLQGEQRSIEKTVAQTGPHADLEYRNLSLGEAEGPNPSRPAPLFVAGKSYHLYVQFINAGTDTGTLRSSLGKTYVGKPLDLADQKSLTKRFESDWKTRRVPPPAVFSQGIEGISEMMTDPLTDADIVDVMAKRKALYYLLRFEFSDRQGIWFSDYCFEIVNPGQFLGLSEPCWVHNRTRYRPNIK